ncbi:hypothetical protein E2562_010103 [Oryza meyeriana var. granulata]|uniref:Uncharacterized protein n=1 Tax=Oryza meyeriana var. granulata TaxID=110450 RepID=A0A6G1EJ58_9ORYZ|nr:hypothetical protein E2562_010103 [Oryza meyeriana var. granulata]
MASSGVALLCLLGLLVAASPAAVAADKIFYQIAFMWPGAYCAQTNAGCCMPTTDVVPAADFYVAGFTVYNATTNSSMTGCNNTPFNMNQLGDTTKLMQYWNNIRCPSSDGESSWKKAWQTSGVCSNLSESAYFETALALRDKINPLSRLVRNDIKPDFGLYSVKKIKKTFQKGIGAAPLIQCSKGPFDKFQLYQLFVCVAEDTKTFIECPSPKKAYTCSDEILFHPFKKWMLKTASTSFAARAIDQLLEAAMEI